MINFRERIRVLDENFYSLNDMCIKRLCLHIHFARNTQLPLRPLLMQVGVVNPFQISDVFFSSFFLLGLTCFILYQPKLPNNGVKQYFGLFKTNPMLYDETYALVVCHQMDTVRLHFDRSKWKIKNVLTWSVRCHEALMSKQRKRTEVSECEKTCSALKIDVQTIHTYKTYTYLWCKILIGKNPS